MDLEGKTILITGANGVLGRAATERAAALGADLVLLDVVHSDPDFAPHNAARRITCDLTDLAALQEALAQIPRIDCVFNLAGGFSMGPGVHEVSTDEWEHLFALNVSTMHNVVRAVVPGMLDRGKGAIVNVGAQGAVKGGAGMGAYCASKSVVMRLTESLSEELKHQGINVNAVLPSVIDTPVNRTAMPDADPSQWVAPTDLANVICYLASEQARAIHGALLPVTGLS